MALVLALLLLTGWGQVHRALHPGALALTVADAGGKAASPGLADEDGSGLCQLLDHLSHGAGPAQTLWLTFAAALPAIAQAMHFAGRYAVLRRGFDARGPPTPF